MTTWRQNGDLSNTTRYVYIYIYIYIKEARWENCSFGELAFREFTCDELNFHFGVLSTGMGIWTEVLKFPQYQSLTISSVSATCQTSEPSLSILLLGEVGVLWAQYPFSCPGCSGCFWGILHCWSKLELLWKDLGDSFTPVRRNPESGRGCSEPFLGLMCGPCAEPLRSYIDVSFHMDDTFIPAAAGRVAFRQWSAAWILSESPQLKGAALSKAIPLPRWPTSKNWNGGRKALSPCSNLTTSNLSSGALWSLQTLLVALKFFLLGHLPHLGCIIMNYYILMHTCYPFKIFL